MTVATWSIAEVVASFREDAFLSGYADKAQASMISGEELVELTDADARDVFGIKGNIMLKKITKAIETLIAVNDSGTLTSEDAQIQTKTERIATQKNTADLPAGKYYATFISHKKTHSKYGDASSTLSRSLKVLT